jgi:tetratricopeptide (TPR) repeat protein
MKWKNRTAGAVILVCIGCRSIESPPTLPDVSTTSFLPAIRQTVETAVADAKAQPDNAAAVGRLGMVLHAHQQLGSARRCYHRASLLDPRNADWRYYLGVVSDGPAAVEPLRASLRLRDYLPAKLKLGEVLLSLGDSAAARDVFRGLNHPAALFGYGRATNDATYYERALAAFPQYGAAMFALAQYYQRTGRSSEAQRLMSDYSRFNKSAPPVDDPLMHAVRALNQGPEKLLSEAMTLEARADLAGAAELQLRAIELDPKLTQAHVNLISLYGRLGDPAQAEKHYREATALNANALEAHYNFGVLCYRLKRRDEARTAFARALAIDPGHAEAHNNLGTMLEEDGKLDSAAEHFRRATELQPSFALARFHLGRIYANQRRYSEAIEQFKRAVESAEGESKPTYLYALGATQARAGDAASAAVNLTTARERALSLGQTALAASISRDLERSKR